VLIWLGAVFVSFLSAGCGSDGTAESSVRPLVFNPDTLDFSFVDSNGNRIIYESVDNTLIVEPDIDLEELALAFCSAERESEDPAKFSLVALVLAEGVTPFIETVDRVCER
jgi:hypothetical protein